MTFRRVRVAWRGKRARRGMVLVVILGVLSVLAILGFAFTVMSGQEKGIATSYVDMTRAKMLAQSGIEQALVSLRKHAEAGSGSGRPNPSIADDYTVPWLYGRPATQANPNYFYDPRIPLDVAYMPCFSYDPNTGRVNRVRIRDLERDATNVSRYNNGGIANDPREFGVSGTTLATYGGGYDFWSVKIVDSQGKIWINGPRRDSGTWALADCTRVTLNNLSDILAVENFTVTRLGDRISQFRAARGGDILTKPELKEILGATENERERNFEILDPHITLYAWVDPTTIDPRRLNHPRTNDPNIIYDASRRTSHVPQVAPTRPAQAGEEAPFEVWASCGTDRLVADDRGDYAFHWYSAENTWESPSGAGRLGEMMQPRAPVNVNTATPQVIRAMMTGLAGVYLERTPDNPVYTGNIRTVSLSSADAQVIATRLVSHRGALISSRGYGFASWTDFDTFVDDVLGPARFGGKRSQLVQNRNWQAVARLDLIKANANPNSRLNKFNPDFNLGSRYGDLDKSDMTSWSMEFTFNSKGYYEIESIGRVLGPQQADGRPTRAEKKIVTAVKNYEVYKHSTQREFLVNKESGTGIGREYCLHPQNLADANADLYAAEYDGYLTHATRDWQTQLGLPFHASYTADFGRDAYGPAERGVSIVSPASGGTPGGAGNGASELFVDGLFVHETRRYPTYTSGQNMYGASTGIFNRTVDDYVRNERASDKINFTEGTLELWFKPTWMAGEFATRLNNRDPNPRPTGSRTLFSCGEGKLGYLYSNRLGPKDQSVCDNRIYVHARYEDGGHYMFASHATRLSEPWGWAGVISPLPRPNTKDNVYYWGKYQNNWFLLPERADQPERTRNWYYAGRWHHVRFVWANGDVINRGTWNNGNMSWLFVDGMPCVGDPRYAGRAEPSIVATAWSLFIGSNRFKRRSTNGYPCNADGTIDDVRIYNQAIGTASFVPPPRYHSNATYRGRIGDADRVAWYRDVPFTRAGKLVMVSWTVYHPGVYTCTSGRVRLTSMDTIRSYGVQLSIRNDAGQTVGISGTTDLPTDGKGVSLNDPSNGRNPLIFDVGDFLHYTLTTRVSGSYVTAVPIVDDVTFRVIPSGNPTFFYYSIQ